MAVKRLTGALALCLCTFSTSSWAEPADEIIVWGSATDLIGTVSSGSDGTVGKADFELRPLMRVGELVEIIPGMIATQHSGTGKANQYFLRGFNLDHGTDFAGFIDGMPINFRTHGHGQGYLDLNFLIPEIIERVDYSKGTHHADGGDFAVAGTARFNTYDTLPRNFAELTFGGNGYIRGVAGASLALSRTTNLLAAAEAVRYDSPFKLDEDLKKHTGFLKLSSAKGNQKANVSLSLYDASWNATDQVPLRAIESGAIDRLGFIDPDLGGETFRAAFQATLGIGAWEFGGYLLYYDFRLWSNFTYFANDPVNGDEFEQRDHRLSAGAFARSEVPVAVMGKRGTLRYGANVHHDHIFTVGLFNTDARQRLSTVRDDMVQETSLSGFAELELSLTDQLRAILGLRGDAYFYDVEANLAANSDDGSDARLSPSIGLAYAASDAVELYLNYGHGFHSNDVRGAAISIDPVTLAPVDSVDVLVRARGGEAGIRVEQGPLNASLVGFFLLLDSELVFVGDAGTTEPNDATKRYGLEFDAFWHAGEWMVLDFSTAWTHARFDDVPSAMNRIPQSVGFVLGAGVTLFPMEGLSATMRLRHFGEAPLIEDDTVRSEPTTLVNLGLSYDWRFLTFGFDIYNLFGAKDADISYFYESQLAGEGAPVEDLHLHPVEPRQFRGRIRIRF